MKTKNLRLLLPAVALVAVGLLTWKFASLSHPAASLAAEAPPHSSRPAIDAAPSALSPTRPNTSLPASPGAVANQRATAEAKRNFTLDAATARIETSATPLSSADGLFDRAFIPEKGATRVSLSVPTLLAGEEVTVAAPNGGKLTRKNGPMHFTPKTAGPAQFDLAFEPTMGRGAYTITIRQAGALTTLDFWAGEPNPVGQPGPAYVATPSTETSVESIP